MTRKQPNARAPAPKAPRKEAPGKVGPGAKGHRDEMVATTLARDAFARERYEFLLRIIFVLFVLLGFSLAVNVIFGLRETKIRYFALSPEGSTREIIALDRPIQSVAQVRSWATEAIVGALTLDFANYQQNLNDIRLSFTDAGWRSFQDALKRSQVLDRVISQQLVTSVAPAGAPVVSKQGDVGGTYGWVLEVPMLVTYEATNGKDSKTYNVAVTVVRRSEAENPSGLGIAQIIVR